MKTSNTILLSLLVIIFAIPLLLAFSLKRKVQKGEYTLVKHQRNGHEESVQSGAIEAFKVISVVSPAPELLTCHLKHAADMNYSYNKQPGEDSISVFTTNDTLFVNYVRKDKSNDHNNLAIHINIHSFNNLVIDGAVVVLDSLPESSTNLTVTLKNKGVIKDGTEKKKEPADKKSSATPARQDKRVAKTSMNLSVKDMLIFHLL